MITQEQLNEIVEGQKLIAEGINKLLALFTLEPLNEATNPILNLSEAAKLLGTSPKQLSEACKKNEVPYRLLGSKYLFSRVALTAWLHNVNMSYLFEKMERHKKYCRDRFQEETTEKFLENWIRFTINPSIGIGEEFHFSNQSNRDDVEIIDLFQAAELLGVTEIKMREWANGFLYHKIPLIREGRRFKFIRRELLEWMKTPGFIKLKDDYVKNKERNDKRLLAVEERKEAERLAKEERKRIREEKLKRKSKQ
ncbi:UNVERIFIED_CONTAM: excisionase family DNA binding protein [Acetivibrio alkalicellulosi]